MTDSSGRGFLVYLFGIFLASAVGASLTTGAGVLAYGTAGASIVFLLAAWFWPRIAKARPEFAYKVMVIATDLRWWLGVLLVLWVLTAEYSLLLLVERNQYRAIVGRLDQFQTAMERWLLPRRLTEDQQTRVGQLLQKANVTAPIVRIDVIRYDQEVENFASDIENALERGNWLQKRRETIERAREGVSLNWLQAPGTTVLSGQLTPAQALYNALREAGISLDGFSTSGSAGQSSDSVLVITIGARPRDTQGVPVRWPFSAP